MSEEVKPPQEFPQGLDPSYFLRHARGCREGSYCRALLAYFLYRKRVSLFCGSYHLTAQQALILDEDWFFNVFLPADDGAMDLFLKCKLNWTYFAMVWALGDQGVRMIEKMEHARKRRAG